mmetsp:Transcript_94870/g.290222  ORF Transcript_94870/g.290222 Transcript_94870/m.290222 type:complete len:230 (-) Transcript_94870:963-1652(-)
MPTAHVDQPIVNDFDDGVQVRPDEVVETLFRHHAEDDEDGRRVLHGDQPDQRRDIEDEGHDDTPEQRPVLFRLAMCVSVLRDPLEAQGDGAFNPTLLGAEEAFGRLRHAEGKLAVHVMGVLADQDAVERAGCVFDLATGVELLALDLLRPYTVIAVADTLLAAFPDRRVVAVMDLPHAIGPTRTDATATVADHRIQAEELGVVVVQIIKLVSVLWVMLRCLREADQLVQ